MKVPLAFMYRYYFLRKDLMNHLIARTLLVALSGLSLGALHADPNQTYLEGDGIVLFETEDADANNGWTLKTDLANYSGTGYLEWTGANSYPLNSAGKDSITYHFRIETAGNYQMIWRSHIALGDSNTDHNDSWVRLATGVDIPEEHPLDGWTKVYMNKLGSWTWRSVTVDHVGNDIRQYFERGDHTIEISGRSKGHAIDKIALYRYEDVGATQNQIDQWSLSQIVQGDGTVVTPIDIDPDDNSGIQPVELVNVIQIDDQQPAQIMGECSANTLTLPASNTAIFNPTDSNSIYRNDERLIVSPVTASALFLFDLSLIPPSSSASLEYRVGETDTNGSIRLSIGSNSDWADENAEPTVQPYAMTELAVASGGWSADASYRTSLASELLTTGLNTFILSSDQGTDSLSIVSATDAEHAPSLILSGEDDFCANWQASIDAQNEPPEPPVEPAVEETPQPTESPEQPESQPALNGEADPSAGAMTWWLMLAMALLSSSGRLTIRQRRLVALVSSVSHSRSAD